MNPSPYSDMSTWTSPCAMRRAIRVHLESVRANTVDAKSAFVAISRARAHAAVYTESRDKLAGAIETRSGERAAALEPVKERARATRPQTAKGERGMGLE